MIMPTRYRRGKRVLAGGGWAMNQGENWDSAGNFIGAGGNFAADIWDQLNPPDKYGYDKNLTGKSALKGAASGAAIGTSILPGWGTLAGGIIGGVGGLIAGDKQQDKALEAKHEAIQARTNLITQMARPRLNNYDFNGQESEQSLYAMGGQLKPLNSDTVEVQGRTHAEGGVQLADAEVEDNETISGDYVFSDLLGFAKPHKRIAMQIGKIEKKPINSERKTTLEILRKKEQVLKQQQEQARQDIGANLYDNINRQLGGQIKY